MAKKENKLKNRKVKFRMKESQMHLINKMFNDKSIRTVWNKEEEKYYISVVDMIEALTDSEEPRKYWNWLKNKLKKEEEFETSSITRQLKLKAKDGKYRFTDVVDIEGMFRIVESVPSKNAEPMKLWLARLGKERIDEVFDPSLTVQRAIDTYRTKGYDEEWIIRRIKGIQDRKKLTDIWNENGVTTDIEYSILTNEIYKEWSGMTSKEYKEFKGLKKESLRDNMTDIEILLSDLGELATREIANKNKPQGLDENKIIAKRGGNIAKKTKEELEKELNESVVSTKRYINSSNNNLKI